MIAKDKAKTVTVRLYHTYRHRWLGLAFVYVAMLPVALGLSYGEKVTNWISHAAFKLMGSKVVVE